MWFGWCDSFYKTKIDYFYFKIWSLTPTKKINFISYDFFPSTPSYTSTSNLFETSLEELSEKYDAFAIKVLSDNNPEGNFFSSKSHQSHYSLLTAWCDRYRRQKMLLLIKMIHRYGLWFHLSFIKAQWRFFWISDI